VNPLVLASVMALFSVNAFGSFQNPDACKFIRDKIANLPKKGGEVTIRSGIYICETTIVIDRDNVWLHGLGEVTLKLADHSNAPVIVMGDAVTPPRALKNIKVSDLHIDGNRAHQTEECWGGPCDSGDKSFIRNNGITVRALTNSSIENVYVTGARSGGVVTERGCYGLHINNLTVVDSYFDGFAGYQTYGAVLERMTLMRNLASGISLDIDFSKNVVKNSHLENNGDVGIFMRDSRSNRFENLTISQSGNHGVFLSQGEPYDLTTCPNDNEFKNLTVIKAAGAGFRLNSPCINNKLTGTTEFLKNRGGCISEDVQAHLSFEGSVTCRN
jgi:parallel beta-helix repeat protein